MPESSNGAAGTAAVGGAEPPGRAALVLRPLGYLLVGLVWTTIWLLAVLLLVGSVPYLAFVDSEGLVAGVEDRLSTPLGVLGLVIVGLPVLALAIGAGGWYVLTASWPLAVLSFTYAVRALRSDYRGERLSRTSTAVWGSSVGPPTVGRVALSLQPVRATPFTDAVMRFYAAGWSVDGRTVLAMLPAGLAWPAAITALVPGVSGAVHLVAGLLAVVLLATSAVLGVRAFRARLSGPVGPLPDGGVGELTAEQRSRRLTELRRQRERRLGEGVEDAG
ncbi:hypothetical protein BCE75_102441 [Isoptericola sp. CG 20/1183]|uniref:SNARE associated Golgi protein n=1 Tax=Isoptericola halotolerans TaxID=300560 RepID=A0ABX5EJM2_9MICO|nr:MULTISPECIES: hypothetical protein [Isoptericola]PRZ09727.1 hypothetical protein BCE75_102441 [Isoptericola sp. CG 20/1183]PRZ10528.1 hypothetical protein BCL65_101673 [Isoptericola halotolerans]